MDELLLDVFVFKREAEKARVQADKQRLVCFGILFP